MKNKDYNIIQIVWKSSSPFINIEKSSGNNRAGENMETHRKGWKNQFDFPVRNGVPRVIFSGMNF